VGKKPNPWLTDLHKYCTVAYNLYHVSLTKPTVLKQWRDLMNRDNVFAKYEPRPIGLLAITLRRHSGDRNGMLQVGLGSVGYIVDRRPKALYKKCNTVYSESPLHTLPSRCSCSEQLSMKIWATTDRHESTICDLWTSNRNSGFLIMFTQNRSSRLQTRANDSQCVVVIVNLILISDSSQFCQSVFTKIRHITQKLAVGCLI